MQQLPDNYQLIGQYIISLYVCFFYVVFLFFYQKLLSELRNVVYYCYNACYGFSKDLKVLVQQGQILENLIPYIGFL